MIGGSQGTASYPASAQPSRAPTTPQANTGVTRSRGKWSDISASRAGSVSSRDSCPIPRSERSVVMTWSPSPITQTRMFDVPQSTPIHRVL